jgi:hypothetical protein
MTRQSPFGIGTRRNDIAHLSNVVGADVCVLQSCLGLLSLDYEVYILEDLLFSSSPNAGRRLPECSPQARSWLAIKLYITSCWEVCVAKDFQKRWNSNLGLCPRIFRTPPQEEHLWPKQTQSR